MAVLEMWAYEACRLFRDKLLGEVPRSKFDNILETVMKTDWGLSLPSPDASDYMFVTWGAAKTNGSSSSGRFGVPLGRLSVSDMEEVVEKAVINYSELNYLYVCMYVWQMSQFCQTIFFWGLGGGYI